MPQLTDDPRDQAYRLDTFGIDSAVRLRPVLGRLRRARHQLRSPTAACSSTASTRSITQLLLQPHRRPRRQPLRARQVPRDGRGLHRFPSCASASSKAASAWAVSLLADLIGHWDKRNAGAIGTLDPAILDVDALMADASAEYGEPTRASPARRHSRALLAHARAGPRNLDDFAAAASTRPPTSSTSSATGCTSAARPTTRWSAGPPAPHQAPSGEAAIRSSAPTSRTGTRRS